MREEVYSAAVLVSRKAVLCFFLHKLSQHDQDSWLYGVRKREGGSIRGSATSPTLCVLVPATNISVSPWATCGS
jgi:hypothetical protein